MVITDYFSSGFTGQVITSATVPVCERSFFQEMGKCRFMNMSVPFVEFMKK